MCWRPAGLWGGTGSRCQSCDGAGRSSGGRCLSPIAGAREGAMGDCRYATVPKRGLPACGRRPRPGWRRLGGLMALPTTAWCSQGCSTALKLLEGVEGMG
jgi:hypothetical protein